MENLLAQMGESIIDGDEILSKELAEQGLAQGLSPLQILNEGFFPGMQEVGRRFEASEMWLPEIVTSAEAMEEAMVIIKEAIIQSGAEALSPGRIVIGTVRGDVHDIGKNIVKTMLQANGFDVLDLGKDVPVRTFIEKAKDFDADLIAASALMTSTMLYMPEIIECLTEVGLRDRFKVIVGGAPVVDAWAREIGADGYSPNAAECVQLCKNLIN